MMPQENKQLLLKDIPARLPYRVIVDIKYSKEAGSSDRLRICSEGYLVLNADLIGLFIEDEIYLKPYLRPMSSMTEEERTEIDKLNRPQGGDWVVQLSRGNTGLYNNFSRVVQFKSINKVLDYLNAHHFDYRGLIEKGLAIEITKENNPYK